MDSLIKFRKTDNTFQRSIDERSANMGFNFFDGPPFASGTPHYGHLLAGAIKDVIPRYMTMRGYQVKRKRGWDCHGLPVEKAVEKDLGIDGKRDIETKIGIESFVEKCRAYVNDTNDIRQWFIDHTARRADIDNAYYTMDLDFMESVIYCFSKIYNDNLVYKGFKVQRYCPSCATPLANNEVSDGYEDKTDAAITVKFQLDPSKTQKELMQQMEHTPDGCLEYARAIIKNEKGEIFQFFKIKEHEFIAPGGKIDKGETAEQTLKRELKEELWVDLITTKYIWSSKCIYSTGVRLQHFYDVEISWEIKNIEIDKHKDPIRVGIESSENEFGFALNIQGNIIDEPQEIMGQFADIYSYVKRVNQIVIENNTDINYTPINLLAWTTTPRTLPSNMFLAAGAEIEYSMVYDFSSKEYYILATNLLKKYYKNPEDFITIRRFKGKELQGLHYTPLFDYITNSSISEKYKNQFFQILNAEFVSTEDGTWIVHIAPTFGEEDFRAVTQILPANESLERLFIAVNEYGEFDEQVSDYQGMKVFDTNKPIIERLKEEKKLIKSESLTHSYPHCWRCHTPLINKAMSSRFIKEQEMNSQTWQAAEEIKFVPESVSNRFVNGLKQAPDWNIARNRYRGSPLPIRQNTEDENDTFSLGTLEEIYQLTLTGSKNLEKRTDENWKTIYRDTDRNKEMDLHKPYVDNYRGIKDWKTYKRIPEVMDCWFESGAMPFGQEHYIGQKEMQEKCFTADFIAEGLDQTRGRFRSLHILGHAIKGENAAKNIVVNGLILAEDGKKMSKSLKNYPDPKWLIEKRGGDSFRLYCLSSPVVRAEPMRFNEKGVEQAFRDFTIPLQNVFNFFETYAKIDNWESDWTEVRFANNIFTCYEGVNEEECRKMAIEKITRINPEIIITSKSPNEQDLQTIKAITTEYCKNEIKIISILEEELNDYFMLLQKYKKKNILIISDNFSTVRNQIYTTNEETEIQDGEIIELPTYQLTNDLDKWILAELNKTLIETDTHLSNYALDEATKSAVEFMDKLTNRYLRRSRRRFRANGITSDKQTAYATLYHVFKRYLQILAPFAPFITESLRLELACFNGKNCKAESIHLSTWPIANKKYINEQLIEETATVRKIIKMALFVRAKNKIAVKQPLQKLSIKID